MVSKNDCKARKRFMVYIIEEIFAKAKLWFAMIIMKCYNFCVYCMIISHFGG